MELVRGSTSINHNEKGNLPNCNAVKSPKPENACN